ncbi:MAG TPA: hypothetical protein VEF04_02095, partial [Blastocatellia bacterium]|nr:hypothetical protein [Blastocatellia bacterium]
MPKSAGAKIKRAQMRTAVKAEDRKTNPFDERSNHRARHPALNRKVKGAKRNVAQARSKAQEKRETDLLAKFARRNRASEVVDKRFGEDKGGDKLSNEEKMLRRFQAVRMKKTRSSKFRLGDDDAGSEDEDEDDNGLTHQGKSLKEVLDEDADLVEEEDDDEDVEALVERLKRGETLNALSEEPKKHLTKREAMLDVVRKSKILKMERQREKEEDEDERDRVDALMKDVVTGGHLTFRPTGNDAKELERKEAKEASKMDEYEKMVRELQLDRGPRAAATERTKTAEEIAAEELKQLEAKEAERVKRMEADDASEAESNEDDEDDTKKRRK